MSCLICERIEMIKNGTNPHFVIELDTGYVVIGDHQRFKGYTLFLCKNHSTELHHLEYSFKMKFLEEMSLVAEAVQLSFNAEKMNYELLGNGDAHIHWHLFPRNKGDMSINGPVWWTPKEEMYNDIYKPTPSELSELVGKLKNNIIQLRTK